MSDWTTNMTEPGELALSDTPDWISALIPASTLTRDELVDLAIAISCASACSGGGPFGAVLADRSGNVIECGWNRVVLDRDSTCHAEIHCIRRAQRKLGTHDLSRSPATLYCSCSPCIQCFGAIYWSGIKEVAAAACSCDAETCGFDEGPISQELWDKALEKKGIRYFSGAKREKALEAFHIYKNSGGKIY